MGYCGAIVTTTIFNCLSLIQDLVLIQVLRFLVHRIICYILHRKCNNALAFSHFLLQPRGLSVVHLLLEATAGVDCTLDLGGTVSCNRQSDQAGPRTLSVPCGNLLA